MVKAMYERSPGYFKQFQKNFRFLSLKRNQNHCLLKFQPYACTLIALFVEFYLLIIIMFCLMCQMLLQNSLKKTKLYSVPCLYTTFNCLFSNGKDLETIDTIFQKIEASCGIQWSNVTDEGRHYNHSKTFTQFGQWRWPQNSSGCWKY